MALAAAGAGWLVLHDPWVGQPLMVLALCLGIFARRYGPTTRQAGRLVALPFLALLITPAPSVQASGSPSILWARWSPSWLPPPLATVHAVLQATRRAI